MQPIRRRPSARMLRALLPLALALPLGGCLVRTAADVVTLPVRAASQGVDWATTSQDEADRNRGRKERKQEARERKEARKAEAERRKQERRAQY